MIHVSSCFQQCHVLELISTFVLSVETFCHYLVSTILSSVLDVPSVSLLKVSVDNVITCNNMIYKLFNCHAMLLLANLSKDL